MARVCDVTGKRPMSGHNVSHSNRKTKRRFLPNLHERRVFCEDTGTFIRVRISRKGLKLIDKVGVKKALEKKAS
ncbi:MAG TPA: 50S ribosomal protein L28 [Gammaproteobacteria bacterium]|nr:50S ribosomal protein L28 [Gammaproteobacteria bacterium]